MRRHWWSLCGMLTGQWTRKLAAPSDRSPQICNRLKLSARPSGLSTWQFRKTWRGESAKLCRMKFTPVATAHDDVCGSGNTVYLLQDLVCGLFDTGKGSSLWRLSLGFCISHVLHQRHGSVAWPDEKFVRLHLQHAQNTWRQSFNNYYYDPRIIKSYEQIGTDLVRNADSCNIAF